MRLELTGRHITISPALRVMVDEQLARVHRMLNSRVVSVQVVLTKEKTRVHADATLHARGEHFLHGEATGRDVPMALGAAADKVDAQVQRLKNKWSKGKRQSTSAGKAAPRPAGAGAPDQRAATAAARTGDGEGRALRVIRARRYDVKPMTVDDAALEVSDGAGAFLVFRNAATDTINVLFRRPDGNLGLIEAEA